LILVVPAIGLRGAQVIARRRFLLQALLLGSQNQS
jgi:hypothetical protein